MVFNAIRFLLSSQIANMAAIFISVQQKFALVRSFQDFAIKFQNQKRFLACLNSASKSLLSWRGKCDFFVTRVTVCLAMDSSNLAKENNVSKLSEFQMLVQK